MTIVEKVFHINTAAAILINLESRASCEFSAANLQKNSNFIVDILYLIRKEIVREWCGNVFLAKRFAWKMVRCENFSL